MPRPAFRTLEALRPAGVLPTCAQAALAPWGALSAPSFLLSSGFISREMFCLVSLVWSRFSFYRVLIGHVVSFMAPPATPRPLQWRHRLPSYLWHFLSPAQWLSCLGVWGTFVEWMDGRPCCCVCGTFRFPVFWGQTPVLSAALFSVFRTAPDIVGTQQMFSQYPLRDKGMCSCWRICSLADNWDLD